MVSFNPPKYFNFCALVGVLFIGVLCILYTSLNFNFHPVSFVWQNSFPLSDTLIGQENKTKTEEAETACRLPQLDPYHPSIVHLLKDLPSFQCEDERFPLLFNSTVEPTPRLVPVLNLAAMKEKVKSCCFREMRADQNGQDVSFSNNCNPLSLAGFTEVTDKWEFVLIECVFRGETDSKNVDIHTFFHDDPPGSQSTSEEQRPLNVIVLAIDATSHMNFIRSFSQVHRYLTRNLSAVEMHGYNKIGENTFLNLGPMLTNRLSNGALYNTRLDCDRFPFVDECPLIWKSYKAAGYRTLYAEDDLETPLFHFHGLDFRRPPTDHYFRAFSKARKSYLPRKDYERSKHCIGPRLAGQVMIDYVEKMAVHMSRRKLPFFQFAYTGTVTHDYLNGGRLIADNLLESLQRLDQRGVFDNTVLVVLGDHGYRNSPIRGFPQGFFEDRLPAMYLVLPPWFPKQNPTAFQNLVRNSQMLVTVYDVYPTLEDILILNPEATQIQLPEKRHSFGTSLFKPVPLSRTCKTVGIPEQFCVCNINMESTSTNRSVMIETTLIAIQDINSKIKNYSVCATLNLQSIVDSQPIGEGGGTSSGKYKARHRIVFEVSPGSAKFEALYYTEKKIETNEVTAFGTLTRLSKYKDTSWCVDDQTIKPFCICNLPRKS